MTHWTFTPDKDPFASSGTPYFEDAKGEFAANYASRRTIQQAKQVVTERLGLLGAMVIEFRDGTFNINGIERKGYEVVFNWLGNTGVMRAAGLPIRSYSSFKEERVKVQALLAIADWLEASMNHKTFSPGSAALLPYLLVDGKRTLAEALAGGGRLPLLEQGT